MANSYHSSNRLSQLTQQTLQVGASAIQLLPQTKLTHDFFEAFGPALLEIPRFQGLNSSIEVSQPRPDEMLAQLRLQTLDWLICAHLSIERVRNKCPSRIALSVGRLRVDSLASGLST